MLGNVFGLSILLSCAELLVADESCNVHVKSEVDSTLVCLVSVIKQN